VIGIVKGFWGDSSLFRRNLQPPAAFESIQRNIREVSATDNQVDRVYTFGTDNTEFLKQLGYDPIQLSHRPWANPTRRKRYNLRFKWNGSLHQGYSYWWHKFKIIEHALQEFDEGVLWCDFDVLQKQADLKHMLDDLRLGKPIRASLYVQHNWTWGAGWRHKPDWKVPNTVVHTESDSHTAARIVMGCGFLYIRGIDIIRECFEIQDEFPHFLDHQVVSLLFDRHHGGKWIGEEAYLANGWHTNGYYYGRQLYPPRRKEICFQAGPIQKRIRL
jgi:hypothetical protein